MNENELISKNIGLIIQLAKSFNPSNVTQLDEYIQLGRIGFLKALRNHDPKRGALSTIAWHYIRWEILGEIKKEKHMSPLLMELESKQYNELQELLPSTLTNIERSIIQLRIEGFNLREIGQLHNKPRYWADKLYKSASRKIKRANK